MLPSQTTPCLISPKNYNLDFPLFVFLPGMDGTGKLLQTQMDSLEKAFDIRCLAIPPDDLTDWDELSAQVRDLIVAEWEKHPKRSVYLCGESFGGCLAMKVALRSPELIDRIILVNPASSFNQRPLLGCATQLGVYLPEIFYRLSTVALLPFLAALGRTEPSDRRALLNAMKSVPPETVLWRLSLLRDFYIEPTQLKRLTQPILLLAGKMDRILPSVAEAKRLSEIFPNAQSVILPDSGHACLIESEIKLYNILKETNFLEPDVLETALAD